MAYILENGDLLRAENPMNNPNFMQGGAAGLIRQYDWDGNLLWEFEYSDDTVRLHHDVEPLPDGNVLAIAWEYRTTAQSIQAGRDPGTLPQDELWPEHIIELQPDGLGGADIVWEWHVWDHLIQDFDPARDNYGVVAEHPELVDINYFESTHPDWLHFNSIDYDPDLDQICLSSRTFGEFWIIDHGTTTEEAAGHTGGNCGMGGDILYRWGNPEAYDAGDQTDRVFWSPHDPHWILPGLPGEGTMLVFNNGRFRPGGNYSTVEEVVTTVDGSGCYPQPPPGTPHGPATSTIIYPEVPDFGFYSGGRSGSQRLPNGHTLICQANTSYLFEIDGNETFYWEYIIPVNDDGPMYQYWTSIDPTPTFRTHRYAFDYPAFIGRDLTPQGPIELDPTPAIGPVEGAGLALRVAPNPFVRETSLSFVLDSRSHVRLDVYDVRGRLVSRLIDGSLPAGSHRREWRPDGLASGVYHYVLRAGVSREVGKVVHLE
jgi:hypothetical protein